MRAIEEAERERYQKMRAEQESARSYSTNYSTISFWPSSNINS